MHIVHIDAYCALHNTEPYKKGCIPCRDNVGLNQHLRSQLVSLERPYSRPEKVGISLIVLIFLVCGWIFDDKNVAMDLLTPSPINWSLSILYFNRHQSSPCMYRFYFDLSLTSSRDWRISHGLSHHFFTNMHLDIEVLRFDLNLIGSDLLS